MVLIAHKVELVVWHKALELDVVYESFEYHFLAQKGKIHKIYYLYSGPKVVIDRGLKLL